MKKLAIATVAVALIATCSVMSVAAHAAEDVFRDADRQIVTSYESEFSSISDEIESDVHAEITSTLVDMKKRRVDIVNADGSTVYTTEDAASIEKISATLDPDNWTLISEIPASATPAYQYVFFDEGKKGLAKLFNKDIAVRFTVYDESYIHMEVLTVDSQGALANSSSMQMSFSIPDSTANILNTAKF
jgi:hypothetical protein